jgi:hypothetical protein
VLEVLEAHQILPHLVQATVQIQYFPAQHLLAAVGVEHNPKKQVSPVVLEAVDQLSHSPLVEAETPQAHHPLKEITGGQEIV